MSWTTRTIVLPSSSARRRSRRIISTEPLAWVLAYLLRPVRNQWIHVAAFFAVPTLVFWMLAGLLGFGSHSGLWGLWAHGRAAAAIGRWAIRQDVSAPGSGVVTG